MAAAKRFFSFITGLSAIILFFLFLATATAARVDKTYPATIPGAEYVGTGTCAECHPKQIEEFKHSTHRQFSVIETEPNGEGCESCHGPGSKHVDEGGGKGVFIINPRNNPQACFRCHLEKKAEFNLQYHHPVIEGKVSCADCHSAHGEEAISGSATSLEDRNETCFKCHPDKKGPFVFEHSAMREGCEICHNVHGSVNEKMLEAGDNNLCLKCHYEQRFNTINAAPNPNPGNVGMYIGAFPHWHTLGAGFTLLDIASYSKMSCTTCHGDVHGSNFHPRYIRYNSYNSTGNLVCNSCH